MITIGIIGGGVAGVSLCMQLKNNFIQSGLNADIIIFEKKNKIGVGIPYDNHDSCYRINIKKHLMEPISGVTGQFSNWIDSMGHPLKKTDFPPRYYFGDYLQASAIQMQEGAEKEGLNITLLTEHDVFDIKSLTHDRFEIHAHTQGKLSIHQVNVVVLSLGHLPTSNFKQFIGQKGYHHNPWDEGTYHAIDATDQLCIIGSKLTAIDVALKLQKIKHRGPIRMVSFSGLLPTIKARDSEYRLTYLTPTNLLNAIKQHQHVPMPLKPVLALVTQELSGFFGFDFDIDTFINKVTSFTAIDRVANEIHQIKNGESKWQKIMSAAYQYITRLWPLLSIDDRLLFQNKYACIFMTFLCSMPLESAYKIYNMLAAEQLTVLGGLDHIVHENGQFCLSFKNGRRLYTQHMINATGAGSELTQVVLLDNLLKKNKLVPHPLGGIKVNHSTLQVLNDSEKMNKHMYAMGDLTKGECFVIVEISRIVEQGKIIARHIVNQMTDRFLTRSKSDKFELR